MVEHRLPKPRAAGSNPVIRSIFMGPHDHNADVAQQAERRTRNAQVTGSIPVVGSRDPKELRDS